MEEIKCPQCKNRLTPPFDRCWICGWEAKGEERRRAKEYYRRWMKERFGKVPGEKKKVEKKKEVVFKPKRRRESEVRMRKKRTEVVEEIPEAIIEGEGPEDVAGVVGKREREVGRGMEEEEEVIPVQCKCGYTIPVKVWEGMKEVIFRCPKCGREGRITLEEEEEMEEEEVFEAEPVEESLFEEEPVRARGGYIEIEEVESPGRGKGRRRRRVPEIFEEEEDVESLTYKKPRRRGGGEEVPTFTVSPEETTEGEVKRCPVCGRPLVWKENLELWYCPHCKEYY